MLADGPRVLILDPRTGEVHVKHPLLVPGEASVLDEHYGGPPPGRPGPFDPTLDRRGGRSSAPSARPRRPSSPGTAGAGHTRLGPELAELNTLTAAHGTTAMVAALERAVVFRRWKAADVRSILVAATGTPTPARPGTRWSST